MIDEPTRGMSPIADLIKGFSDKADQYEAKRKAEWEATHKAEMIKFRKKYGTMMIAKGEDGLYRPTNIPVPRSNGICDDDFVYTGTMEDIPEAFQ